MALRAASRVGPAMPFVSEIAISDTDEASTIGMIRDPQTAGDQSKRLRSVFTMKKSVWRAVIEVGFIVFLFYSNLLMGEFERSGMGQKRGVAWAIGDVFTAANFEIATIAAIIGYILFEFLRKKFRQ